MRIITAFIVVVTLVLVSCAQPVTGEKDFNFDTEVDPSPEEGRSICLVGDSRVFSTPEDFLLDEWDFMHNQGIPGSTSEITSHVIASQQLYFNSMIISVGINDCNFINSVTYIIDCIQLAKKKAKHVYITTIPGVRKSLYFSDTRAIYVSILAEKVNIYIPIIAQNLDVEVIFLDDLLCDGILLKEEYDDGSGIHYNEAAFDEIELLYHSVLSNNR